MHDEKLQSLLLVVASDASVRLRNVFPELTSLALSGRVTLDVSNQVHFLECLTNTEWEVTVISGKYTAIDTGVTLAPALLGNNQSTLNRYRRLGLVWLDALVTGQWPAENPTSQTMLLALGVALIDSHMTALSSRLSTNSVFALLNQGS